MGGMNGMGGTGDSRWFYAADFALFTCTWVVVMASSSSRWTSNPSRGRAPPRMMGARSHKKELQA
jgi:hypothetical protein